MNFLKLAFEQVHTQWKQANLVAKSVGVAVVVLCTVVIVAIGWWSTQSQYISLASGLDPQAAAKLIDELESASIPYRLSSGGSTVLVPKEKWSVARTAAGKQLIDTEEHGQELNTNMWSDPWMNQARILAGKERSLERTIGRFRAVASAKVHVAQPEPSPFVRERQPTTASVVLELRPGLHLSREETASIVATVSNSVEGLAADHITVTDVNGRILWSSVLVQQGSAADRLEYQRQLEAELAAKAELMLSQMLGAGKSIVRVTAQIDFTSMQREETTFDPQGKVKRSEQVKTVSMTATNPSGGGVAGSAAGASGGGPPGGNSEKTSEITTEFDNAKIVGKITEAPGRVERLTVAAMVDLTRPAPADGEPAPPAVTKAQVEAIIKQAVGFDTERNDQIEVLETPLLGAVPAGEDHVMQMQNREFYQQLMRNASLAIASLIGLVLGIMVIRRLKPLPGPAAEPPAISEAQRLRLLQNFTTHAEQNPELVSKILSAWLSPTIDRPEDTNPAATTSGGRKENTRQANAA